MTQATVRDHDSIPSGANARAASILGPHIMSVSTTIEGAPVAGAGASTLRLERWATWGFFTVLALTGILLHRDYGIAWDEPWQVRHGGVLWRFVFEGDEGLLQDRARFHGTIVPFLWILMEKAGFLGDSQQLYYLRHLGNFALFYAGVAGFYQLCRRGFGTWTWALLAALMLVLSPRLFGHGFINPKDVPFMSVFVWAVVTGIRMIERPGWGTVVVHGLVCVVLINFRLLGVLAPALTVGFLAARCVLVPETRMPWPRTLALLGGWTVIICAGVVALWPTLWDAPLQQFVNAFRHLARFPWRGDLLYLGEYYQSDHLPWHYPFVWMAVTIPIAYLALFALGLMDLARRIFVRPRHFDAYWLDLLVLAWLVTPLAAVSILDSVLYDDWRHLYFVYPAMLWFATRGACLLWTWSSGGAPARFRSVWVALFAFALLANAATIAVYHPYQNVYFNRIAGSGEEVGQRFEMDYWGISYRDGLEYILRSDPRDRISVLAANLPGEWNSLILSEADRRRIHYVYDAREADYFITNYRWHREDYPFEPPVYGISAGGTRILGVYAFRPGAPGGG